MESYQIVIDTNVIIAALRSRRGASFKLISMLGSNRFSLNISVPLILEYESIALRQLKELVIDESDLEILLDYVCRVGNKVKIYYLWRPFLKDPKDDHVLELAVNSLSKFIITYNKRDFRGAEKFGLEVLTAKEFLDLMESKK